MAIKKERIPSWMMLSLIQRKYKRITQIRNISKIKYPTLKNNFKHQCTAAIEIKLIIYAEPNLPFTTDYNENSSFQNSKEML